MNEHTESDYRWEDNVLYSPRVGREVGYTYCHAVEDHYVFKMTVCEAAYSQQTLGIIYRKLKELNKE